MCDILTHIGLYLLVCYRGCLQRFCGTIKRSGCIHFREDTARGGHHRHRQNQKNSFHTTKVRKYFINFMVTTNQNCSMKGIGIIGCGKISQVRHIPEYSDNPNAKLIGFFDLARERAEQMAAKYGGKVFDSVEELLADPAIDAVSVCVANNMHADVTIAALKAGKHVLCEKPMATNIEDCERMVEASRQYGRYLMIGQNQRFALAHSEARKLIKQGAIGKVVSFRTTFGHSGPETWSITPGPGTWFFDKKAAVMGVLADLGIHKTDLIQFILDDTITAVTARISTIDKRYADGSPIGVDDNAICIFEMAGGAVGTMTASWTFYGQEDNSTIIYGTEGIIRIYDDPACSLKVIGKDGKVQTLDIDRIQTNDNQTKSGVMDAFVDALEKGIQPPVSGGEVLTAMRAIFGALESSEKGVRVEVNR